MSLCLKILNAPTPGECRLNGDPLTGEKNFQERPKREDNTRSPKVFDTYTPGEDVRPLTGEKNFRERLTHLKKVGFFVASPATHR